MKKNNTIIIGSGPAGLMCASVLKGDVLIIDSNQRTGNKLKVSGGGRCNFTNLYVSEKDYVGHNIKSLKSLFSYYKPEDTLALLDKYNVEYYEKKLGQMFCKNSAQDFIDVLMNEAKGAEFLYGANIKKIEKNNDGFCVSLENGENINCKNLVIASGTKSYSNLGASDFALKIAQHFGIKYYDFSPALVPLTVDRGFADLMGVSINAKVSSGKTSFVDDLLFTHFGLSGPAILKISNYLNWDKNDVITVDFLPEKNVEQILQKAKKCKRNLKQILGETMPKKLFEYLLKEYDIYKNINEISDNDIKKIANLFNGYEIKITGNKGFDLAEICKGGIDINELNNSFESKKIKGLYFIGECLDIAGSLGGFNIHFALSSGKKAGGSIFHG